MRNQRANAIVAFGLAIAVAVAAGIALRFGEFQEAWSGNLCERIVRAIAWTQDSIDAEKNTGNNTRTFYEVRMGELEKQLADANCASGAPKSTESPVPTASPTPTPSVPADSNEECDTHFFANDPNKVSSRSFGPKVKNNGVTKVTNEFFRRNELDTALLSFNLNVTGIRHDNEAEQQKLSEELVKDCEARTKYVAELRDLLDDSKVSIVEPKAQTVGSAYMVDGPRDVPMVEWAPRVERGSDYVVLQIILPSGKTIWLRLACGFQFDQPGKQTTLRSVGTILDCVNGQSRDSEGNCPNT